MRVETELGPFCIILILANPLIPGWILGDPFLNAHYSAYDFVNKRIGFARAAKDSEAICEADLAMDISRGENSKPTTPPSPTAPPTDASTTPPMPASSELPTTANIKATTLAVPPAREEQKVSFFAASAAIGFLAITMILAAIVLRRRRHHRVRFEEVVSSAEEFEMRDVERYGQCLEASDE